MKRISVLALLVTLSLISCHIQGKSKLLTNLKANKKQTLITYGTSLTAEGCWVRQLQDELNKRYPDMVKVINSGKGGMWSKWGIENLKQRVIKKNPDTVLIEFAINDAYLDYKTSVEDARLNLENMIDQLMEANPDCEIILMTMNPPVGRQLAHRPEITKYYQTYREVAKSRKLAIIDHYRNWEKILNEDAKLFNQYVPDGIHPEPEGCEKVITPAILKALGIEVNQQNSDDKK
jgi:lysophospholipase L1-like esterase